MGRETKGDWEAVPGEEEAATEQTDSAPLVGQKKTAATIGKPLLDYGEEYIEPDEEEEEEEDDSLSVCENFVHFVVPSLVRRWKSIAAATVLLTLGIVFLAVSIFSFTQGWWGYASSLLVLAFICGLPGAFVFFVVYKVIRMDPNYDLDIVPDYQMTV